MVCRGTYGKKHSMTDPDYTAAHTEILKIPSGQWIWALPVRGYLCSITGEIGYPAEWPDNTPREDPLTIKITHGLANQILVNKFHIYHHIGYRDGGIIFSQPLVNVNTANPYYIESEFTPAITIYITSCFPRPQ